MNIKFRDNIFTITFLANGNWVTGSMVCGGTIRSDFKYYMADNHSFIQDGKYISPKIYEIKTIEIFFQSYRTMLEKWDMILDFIYLNFEKEKSHWIDERQGCVVQSYLSVCLKRDKLVH